jgi:hypothetical protein
MGLLVSEQAVGRPPGTEISVDTQSCAFLGGDSSGVRRLLSFRIRPGSLVRAAVRRSERAPNRAIYEYRSNFTRYLHGFSFPFRHAEVFAIG